MRVDIGILMSTKATRKSKSHKNPLFIENSRWTPDISYFRFKILKSNAYAMRC